MRPAFSAASSCVVQRAAGFDGHRVADRVERSYAAHALERDNDAGPSRQRRRAARQPGSTAARSKCDTGARTHFDNLCGFFGSARANAADDFAAVRQAKVSPVSGGLRSLENAVGAGNRTQGVREASHVLCINRAIAATTASVSSAVPTEIRSAPGEAGHTTGSTKMLSFFSAVTIASAAIGVSTITKFAALGSTFSPIAPEKRGHSVSLGNRAIEQVRDILLLRQRGDGTGKRDRADAEWNSCLTIGSRKLCRTCNSVADARAGKVIGLGETSRADPGTAPFGQNGQDFCAAGMSTEFVIGLVEMQQNLIGELVHKLFDFAAAQHPSGRIVRRRDKSKPCSRRHGTQHGIDVDHAVGPHRHADIAAAHGDSDRIAGEARNRCDRFVAALECNVGTEKQQFVGAGAEKYPFVGNSGTCRKSMDEFGAG